VKALIIVDMLIDFVDGKLANPRAERIIGPLQQLLDHARHRDWVIVFSNDAHRPDDPELKVWGEHAMEGDPGAQVIDSFEPHESAREWQSPKRSYGAFDGTGLDEQLKALGIDEVVITGQHTHICVRHTSYGALIRGYDITVPSDAVCAFEGVDEDDALEYLKMAYGATVTTVDELLSQPAGVPG
jgi:nicotinamidase-related amidase